MDGSKTTLERAFELAQSGRFSTGTEIKRALAQEGYSAHQLTGPALMRQLRQTLKEARQRPPLES